MGAREGGKKCLKKGQRNEKKYFFVINKYQSVTHVSTWIFQGLYINIVFRSIALVTKKVMGCNIFFFTDRTFFALYYKNFFTKNPLNYYLIKVTKCHCDSVKNESARTCSLFRVNNLFTCPKWIENILPEFIVGKTLNSNILLGDKYVKLSLTRCKMYIAVFLLFIFYKNIILTYFWIDRRMIINKMDIH